MSALDELKAKQKIERTALEWAVLVCEESGGEATAIDAAAQLAELKYNLASTLQANKYCQKLLDNAGKNIIQLKADLKAIEANYEDAQKRLVELSMLMPCGHLARYVVNGDEGTQYCVMCLCEFLTDTTDVKIISKIAEIVSHE